jgi:MFS transporter, ACS family, glucarate transporter
MAAGLAVFALCSYLTRSNISVAAETMMPALNLTQIQMGQIFSGFLWGYAVFQIPGGLLGDWLGSRKTLALSALIWSVASVLTGVVPQLAGGSAGATFALLWGVRFMLGLAQATTFPVGNRVVHNWFAGSERASGGAIMFMGTCTASACIGPLIPALINRYGWQGSFFVTAIPPLVLAVAWYLWSRDTPDQHRWVNEAEAALVHTESAVAAESIFKKRSLGSLLRERNIILLILSYVGEGYVLFIFVFWLYIYLVEQRHLSAMRGGWAAALPWLTALVFTPLGGRLCDRVARRYGRVTGAKAVLVGGYGITGLTLFIAAYAHTVPLSVIALSLSIAFLMASEAGFWSAAAELAGEHVGAVSGIMNTAGIFGGILSTSLVPVLVKEFGWLAALCSGTVFAALCVLLALAMRDRQVSSG